MLLRLHKAHAPPHHKHCESIRSEREAFCVCSRCYFFACLQEYYLWLCNVASGCDMFRMCYTCRRHMRETASAIISRRYTHLDSAKYGAAKQKVYTTFAYYLLYMFGSQYTLFVLGGAVKGWERSLVMVVINFNAQYIFKFLYMFPFVHMRCWTCRN